MPDLVRCLQISRVADHWRSGFNRQPDAKLWQAVGSALLLAAGSALPAQAQVAETPLFDRYLELGTAGGVGFDPGVTVTSRNRPEYDSSGVQAGTFIIRPELDESVGYENNVLATPRPQGSAVIETFGTVSAASDYSLGNIRGSLSVDNVEFPSQSQQSFTNFTAQAGGGYQFGADFASFNYAHLTLSETPGGLDVPLLQQPLAYNIDAIDASYRIAFARTFLIPSLDVTNYDFGNSLVAGANYTQSYRNRVVFTPSLTAGYELSTRRDVIVLVRDSQATYLNPVGGQPHRDYNDVAVLGGLDYDTGLIRYRLLAGYELRNFQSSQFKPISAPIVEASAIWTPSGLTTVTGTAARRIQDSADETTSGYTESYVQLRVDHEYLPNLLLRANTGVYVTQYQGSGSQSLYTVGTGATYFLNRNMQVGINYDFTARTSAANINFGVLGGVNTSTSYADNRVVLQLRLRL